MNRTLFKVRNFTDGSNIEVNCIRCKNCLSTNLRHKGGPTYTRMSLVLEEEIVNESNIRSTARMYRILIQRECTASMFYKGGLAFVTRVTKNSWMHGSALE